MVCFFMAAVSKEKLVTIPLTIFLYKKIFLNPNKKHNPKDEERIRDLEDMLADIKQGIRENRQRRKEERIARRTQKFIKTKK